MSRIRRYDRASLSRVSVPVLITVSVMVLAACRETAVGDHLRIKNDTDGRITVVVEHVSGEQFLLASDLRPGGERVTVPPDDPDVEESGRCTSGPVIAFQDGEEIERFDPPVCFDDGLTLTVDGEP